MPAGQTCLRFTLAAVLTGPLAGVGAPLPARQEYERVFAELRQLSPRGDRMAEVHHLVLRRDVAEFQLDSGRLFVLSPVARRTVAVVFLGTGSFAFRPPLAVERRELGRLLRDTVLTTPLSAAVFIFVDSTEEELAHSLTFFTGEVDARARDRVGAALEFLTEERGRRVDEALMTALLNGTPNGYFAGFVRRPRGEDLLVKIDPYEAEPVVLLRRGKLARQRVQTVSQSPPMASLQDSVTALERHPRPLLLDHYRIEATIGKGFDFSAVVEVRLRGRRDAGASRWIRLLLFDELRVDSVWDDRDAPLAFVRFEGSDELWVCFDSAVGFGETRVLHVRYHGGLIERASLIDQIVPFASDPRWREIVAGLDRWAFIRSTAYWYPRYDVWQPADMEITYHSPARYRFASIGRLVESREVGDVRTTRWVTELPTQQASFNIGEFEEFEITDPRIPSVVVQMNTEAHLQLRKIFLSQGDPQQQVGGDIANSLSFFTTMFGPPLFQRYYATEIPYGHGQAFPGLIHLSWWTFQSVEERGGSEVFRAHEMAHQWWGIGVEPAEYRDAWLSEGFAEFAGWWYMQIILHDNTKYFTHLRDARVAIRRARNDAPPIALGYRMLETDPEHYSLTVYRKGGWVLHMLRNLMIDFDTMNEDPFKAMMRDFYITYRGKHASTSDFQEIVERHTGYPMDWFFDQWVFGTAIPTYTLSWKVEPAGDGKFRLRVRVRQDDAPATFVMPVPLLIEFAGGAQATVRVNVRGVSVEAELLLPAKPARLELNPLESVLAEVRQEPWH